MLLVKTYIAKSHIQGMGLYAYDFIPKGTKIWELTEGVDRVLSQRELDEQPEVIKDFLETYCYRHKGYYILCVDNGRFINHSYESNTDDTSGPYTIAKRDIKPGEEITSNYSDFGFDEDDHKFNNLS